MMRRQLLQENGNGILEAVLFLPVGLFFLFVVVDGGIALVERAGINDAVRSGLAEEGLYNADASPLYLDSENHVQINQPALRQLLEGIAEGLERKVSSAKAGFHSAEGMTFGIEVSALSFAVDPGSGRILVRNHMELVDSVQTPSSGFAQVGALSPEFPFLRREDYVLQELEAIQPAGPSEFAQPLALSYRSDAPDEAKLLYLESAILLYVEVRSVTQGINPSYLRSALGKFYTLQLQHLQALRAQL